jgi:S-adenosylmethionine/arginine decarboxylase-like enzyme
MSKELFHQHLLIRAFVYKPPVAEEVLNKWMTELVADIGMKVVVPAKSKYVDAVGNEGLTGSINIETSHMAIHIWSEQKPARIEMDVYSCSCFERQTILDKLNEWGLVKFHSMMIDRNGDEFKTVSQSNGYEEYKRIPWCCKIGCEANATREIYYINEEDPYDFTHSCEDHINHFTGQGGVKSITHLK